MGAERCESRHGMGLFSRLASVSSADDNGACNFRVAMSADIAVLLGGVLRSDFGYLINTS